MIRKVCENDINRVLEIYAIARENMKKNGNPTQWGNSYPTKAIIEEHLAKEQLYAYVVDDQVCGVFAFVYGEDASYTYIEEGEWLNDEEYATLHIVASSGEQHGVFEQICNFAKERCGNIRIDTHYDNTIMQKCIEKQGFVSCGRIYVRNHSPRKAYQWTKNI